MKKLLTCVIIGALALSAAACGSREERADTEAVIETNEALEAEAEVEALTEETELLEEEEQIADAASAELAPEGEVSTDKLSFPEGDVTVAEEETAAVESAEAEEAPDLSQARDASSSSEEDPVPLGTWAKTAIYATQDSTYHTVYVRIVRVTTQSEDENYVQTAIEANNGYGDETDRIDPAEMDIEEDAELVVLDYEVYVPEDFPTPSYGITEPKIYFTLRNIGGGGFPNLDGTDVYLSMGNSQEMVVREAGSVYEPGHTYGERCIYSMVKGYTDYQATYSSYPDGTSSDETSADIMYTAYQSIR